MTEAEATRISDGSPERTIQDIWSWTSSKYRIRAIVLLLVNILLYAALGCFAYWLRTGEPFAPATDDYWQVLLQTMDPRLPANATLANFVLQPIRLDQVPMHGVVVGLMLAALVSIPILISILYRFPFCLPFALIVAFLAVMPWLALVLTLACVLASVKPFRFSFRYASALLGLVLVLLYFYGASRQASMPLDTYRPLERIKFMAPWMLATIASCMLMAAVLLLAKVVNYRPGAVSPLLFVSFMVPIALFEKYVGCDELYYRLLEQRFQNKFVDRNVGDWFERLAHRKWLAHEEPRPSFEAVRSNVELRMTLELESEAEANLRGAFAEDRDLLVTECDWFLRFFPDSRYARNVLYIKGQSLDMRVDLTAFRNKKEICYYDEFPSSRSFWVWRMALANAPDSVIAVMARYRLATLAARTGEIGEAIGLLEELISPYGPGQPPPESTAAANSTKSVLEREMPEASLGIQTEQIVFQARQLLALLRRNWNDPRYDVRPLCGSRKGETRKRGLLELDPRHPQYVSNLQRIKRAYYPGCLLEDNITLLVARLNEDVDKRVDLLKQCLLEYPHGDARPEALFRLAAAERQREDFAAAKQHLETLLRDYPNSLWASPGRDRLRAIGLAGAETVE